MRWVIGVLVGLLVGVFVAAEPAYPRDSENPPAIPSGSDVDYQLGGVNDNLPDSVGIVVRDRTESPRGGAFNVCYVNGFQTQPDAKRFWRKHWPLVLKQDGKAVTDTAWGEWLLDVRTPAKRKQLARIIGRWTSGCAKDGFDAVEFDNLDSFTRSRHLIKRAQALAFARMLVRSAHRAGLIVGQKNLAGYDGTRIGFDFAVSEECGAWRECDRYAKHFGNQVLAIEYRKRDFRRTCRAHGDQWPVVLRDRNLTPEGIHRYC